MSEGRAQILSNIRRALGRGPLDDAAQATLRARMADPVSGPIPRRAQLPLDERIALFRERVARYGTQVLSAPSWSEVASTIALNLERLGLPKKLALGPDAQLDLVPWQQAGIEVERPTTPADVPVGVTVAYGAIAETGTLVTFSSPSTPIWLNFLAENHLVIVPRARFWGTMEDVWRELRKTHGPGNLPRSLVLITGSSKTGDIAQQLVKGAHGPRSIHVVIVET